LENNRFCFSYCIYHEFYIAFQEMMYETSAEKQNCSHWFANGRYISIQWNENSTLITSSTNETV
jgi:hypothetical protein